MKPIFGLLLMMVAMNVNAAPSNESLSEICARVVPKGFSIVLSKGSGPSNEIIAGIWQKAWNQNGCKSEVLTDAEYQALNKQTPALILASSGQMYSNSQFSTSELRPVAFLGQMRYAMVVMRESQLTNLSDVASRVARKPKQLNWIVRSQDANALIEIGSMIRGIRTKYDLPLKNLLHDMEAQIVTVPSDTEPLSMLAYDPQTSVILVPAQEARLLPRGQVRVLGITGVVRPDNWEVNTFTEQDLRTDATLDYFFFARNTMNLDLHAGLTELIERTPYLAVDWHNKTHANLYLDVVQATASIGDFVPRLVRENDRALKNLDFPF